MIPSGIEPATFRLVVLFFVKCSDCQMGWRIGESVVGYQRRRSYCLHHGVQTSRPIHTASCSLGSVEFLREVKWTEREADGAEDQATLC